MRGIPFSHLLFSETNDDEEEERGKRRGFLLLFSHRRGERWEEEEKGEEKRQPSRAFLFPSSPSLILPWLISKGEKGEASRFSGSRGEGRNQSLTQTEAGQRGEKKGGEKSHLHSTHRATEEEREGGTSPP